MIIAFGGRSRRSDVQSFKVELPGKSEATIHYMKLHTSSPNSRSSQDSLLCSATCRVVRWLTARAQKRAELLLRAAQTRAKGYTSSPKPNLRSHRKRVAKMAI